MYRTTTEIKRYPAHYKMCKTCNAINEADLNVCHDCEDSKHFYIKGCRAMLDVVHEIEQQQTTDRGYYENVLIKTSNENNDVD
jgi:hypothetical protein